MHQIGCKENYLKPLDVAMLGHGFGVSQFPQFYDRIENIYKILPRQCLGIYECEKGYLFLKEKLIVELTKSV